MCTQAGAHAYARTDTIIWKIVEGRCIPKDGMWGDCFCASEGLKLPPRVNGYIAHLHTVAVGQSSIQVLRSHKTSTTLEVSVTDLVTGLS